MNRPNHQDCKFFLGREVEHTPVLGHKTLFVIGCQPAHDIEAILNDPYTAVGGAVTHLYFGANHSFDPQSKEDLRQWEDLICTFLNQGFWCTLDFDVSHTELVAETSLIKYNTFFIPMISVQIPHVQLMNYNAVVKIDDRDFAATNPGVWCHSLHDLQTRDAFTAWTQYSGDEVLK